MSDDTQHDAILLTAGQIIGLLTKFSEDEYRALADIPGLRRKYRLQIRLLAKLRGCILTPETDPPEAKGAGV